jgi:hypothetical protein
MGRHASVGGLLVLAAVCGCSRSDPNAPKTVPGGGTVTLNGQPVEGASVTFSPAGAGRVAYGKTDAQGQFKLSTTNTIPGAVPGAYQVGIAKTRTEGGMTPEESQAYYEKTGQPPPAPTTVEELPEKYKTPASSGLKATVEASGKNEFPFALQK